MPDGLEALFEKNIGTLAASLDRTMQNGLKEYELSKQSGQKGELSHVYISFLLSGVLCRLPWLRIDLYDENDREDIIECFADWNVPSISSELYHDADILAEQAEQMEDYELEKAMFDASEEYFIGFERFMPQIITQSSMAQTVDCQWHFGQFLGNTVTVREKDKKTTSGMVFID